MKIFAGTYAFCVKEAIRSTAVGVLLLGVSFLARAEVAVDRSLFITDKIVLNQITLNDVVQKLIADTGDTRTPTQILASAPFFISDVGAQGGMLAAMQPLAMSNRFDLASANGADCGEYRLAFGGNHPFANGFATFLIFEARYPNPHPEQGVNGCRPVAEFWAALSAVSDPAVRGAQLRQFYLTGINGLPAVVNVNNYRGQENPSGLSGQIRQNVRASRAVTWAFSEFRTLVDGGRGLNVVASTVKDVPNSQFAQDTSDANALAFQQAVLAGLSEPNKNLLAADITHLKYALPFSLNKDSDSMVNVAFTDNSRLFAAVNFNPSGQFAQAIQAKLNQVGSSLTPIQVIDRVNTLTCGGCHGQGEQLGGGLIFDTANQNREFLNNVSLDAVMGATQHVEAEAWTQMSGVQTEPTSDTGGGLNVGWIDTNDWMTYTGVSMNAPTREYVVQLRVANGGNTPARFRLEQPGGGTVYQEIEVPSTTGWQKWLTIQARIIIPNGLNGLAIKALSGGFNINWIEVTPILSGSFDVKPSLKNSLLPERKKIFEQFLTGNSAANMLVNGDFSNSSGWQTYIDSQAAAQINIGGSDQRATINIQQGGSQTWQVQLMQPGLNIVYGKTYELTFSAMTLNNSNSTFEVTVERNGGDWAKYLLPKVVNVTGAVNTYSFQFTMPQNTDPVARLTFSFGTRNAPIAVDNIVLRQVGQ